MEDWSNAPVFGHSDDTRPVKVRPSAYAVIADANGCVAIVKAPDGVFLVGGGVEPGETPEEAVMREAREECGFAVRVGACIARAVQHADSIAERTQFEKRSTFFEATIVDDGACVAEPGHELCWVDPAVAPTLLAHPSHGWAVSRWRELPQSRYGESPSESPNNDH